MKRFAAILALVALFAGATCKKLEDGTELDIQMFALILVLTNYAMNQNVCLTRSYREAVVGQSFGPFSSKSECFHFGATGPFTASMTTNSTALGSFTAWVPQAYHGIDADNPTLAIPASNDLWVLATCQQSSCSPWSVQF